MKGNPVNYFDFLWLLPCVECHDGGGLLDKYNPDPYKAVSPEVSDAINDILKDKTQTGKTGKVKEYSGEGGENACVDNAKKLPTNGDWKTTSNGTILIPLSGGGTANIHPSNTRGGVPTLEVPNPNATNPSSTIKIRYY